MRNFQPYFYSQVLKSPMKLRRELRKIFNGHLKCGQETNSTKEVFYVHKHFLFLLGFMLLYKNDENIFHKYLGFDKKFVLEIKSIFLFRVGQNFMNFLKQIYALDMKLYIDYVNEQKDNVSIN